MSKRDEMYARITKHGEQLLALFPDAVHKDPVLLCKRLRSLEARASRAAEQWCNGEIEEATWEVRSDHFEAVLNQILRPADKSAIFINSDPRGYALKVDDVWLRSTGLPLYRDWGGYGIIAPDLTEA